MTDNTDNTKNKTTRPASSSVRKPGTRTASGSDRSGTSRKTISKKSTISSKSVSPKRASSGGSSVRAKGSANKKDDGFFVKLNRILTRVLLVLVLILGFSIYKFVVAFQALPPSDHASASIEADHRESDFSDQASAGVLNEQSETNHPADSSDFEEASEDPNENTSAMAEASSEESSDPDFENSDTDSENSDSNSDASLSDPESEEASQDTNESDFSMDNSAHLPSTSVNIPDPLESEITESLRIEQRAAFQASLPSSEVFYESYIPSYCQTMSIGGMYYTGIAYDLYEYSYEYCDGRLFVNVTDGNSRREIFDMETGELLGSYEIDEQSVLVSGCLKEGRSYLIDSDLNLRIYRQTGELDQLMSFSVLEGMSVQGLSMMVLTQDGDFLCIREAGSPSFTFIRLYDGTSFTMNINAAPASLGVLKWEDDLILTDYRNVILTIDPDNHSWNIRSIEVPFDVYSAGYLYDASTKNLTIYNPDEKICSIQSFWSDETWLGANGSILVTAIDRNEDYLLDSVHFYDLERQECRELYMPEGYGVYNVLFPGSSQLLLCYNHGDSDGFAFVDLDELNIAGNLDAYYSSVHILEEETREIADLAYENFGVVLLYGEDGDDFELDDYVGSVCMDGLKNYEAVLTVYNLLLNYPEGMLRESYEGFCESMQIYLCGDIRGRAGSGLNIAGGVSNLVGNHLITALDIYEPYAYNLPHELSHLFDFKIRQYFWTQDQELDDYWASLSPDGAFLYSYSGYETLDYYIYGMADDDDVYFTRNYSRTTPGEDRATLFETMFAHEESQCNPILYTGHLMEKANAYAQLLRKVFSSCKEQGTLYWEIGLT